MDLKKQQKQDELESENLKFKNIKTLIQETIEKTKQKEKQFKEEKSSFQKNMINLQRVLSVQEIRKGKLDNDLRILSERRVDLDSLREINAKLKANLAEEMAEVDYSPQLEELESEIKSAYLSWETCRQIQAVVEMGEDLYESVKDNPVIDCSAEKRWITFKNKQLDLIEKLAQTMEDITQVENDFKEQQAQLCKLKQEEENLLTKYKNLKV